MDLFQEHREVLDKVFLIAFDNHAEIDAMFSAGEEGLAVIMPIKRQHLGPSNGRSVKDILLDVLTDHLHHQWPRVDGLEVASGHL